MIPNSDVKITTLVDAGYLTWIYGTAGRKSWHLVRKNYSMKAGALLLMDSRESARKEYYPEYKSHRLVKREEHMEKTEMVREFQMLIREDPSFRKLEISGLEADDLLAVMLMKGYNYSTVGRDKDLLQLKGLHLEDVSGDLITLHHYSHSLPKRLAPLIRQPKDVLFSLVLMGDKSDDIPRLLPPRQMDLGFMLMRMENPWTSAREIFGDALLRNLYLAVLPSPFCFDPMPSPEEVFAQVSADFWPHAQALKGMDPQDNLRPDLCTELARLQDVLR